MTPKSRKRKQGPTRVTIPKSEQNILQLCKELIRDFCSSNYATIAWPFYKPIKEIGYDPKVNNFNDIADRPICLGAIRYRLEKNEYENCLIFAYEMREMFRTCFEYYQSDHYIAACGRELQLIFERRFLEIVFVGSLNFGIALNNVARINSDYSINVPNVTVPKLLAVTSKAANIPSRGRGRPRGNSRALVAKESAASTATKCDNLLFDAKESAPAATEYSILLSGAEESVAPAVTDYGNLLSVATESTALHATERGNLLSDAKGSAASTAIECVNILSDGKMDEMTQDEMTELILSVKKISFATSKVLMDIIEKMEPGRSIILKKKFYCLLPKLKVTTLRRIQALLAETEKNRIEDVVIKLLEQKYEEHAEQSKTNGHIENTVQRNSFSPSASSESDINMNLEQTDEKSAEQRNDNCNCNIENTVKSSSSYSSSSSDSDTNKNLDQTYEKYAELTNNYDNIENTSQRNSPSSSSSSESDSSSLSSSTSSSS